MSWDDLLRLTERPKQRETRTYQDRRGWHLAYYRKNKERLKLQKQKRIERNLDQYA